MQGKRRTRVIGVSGFCISFEWSSCACRIWRVKAQTNKYDLLLILGENIPPCKGLNPRGKVVFQFFLGFEQSFRYM